MWIQWRHIDCVIRYLLFSLSCTYYRFSFQNFATITLIRKFYNFHQVSKFNLFFYIIYLVLQNDSVPSIPINASLISPKHHIAIYVLPNCLRSFKFVTDTYLAPSYFLKVNCNFLSSDCMVLFILIFPNLSIFNIRLDMI